jgi:2-phosphoglycerate kinase
VQASGSPGCRVLLLTGASGTGKSTVAQHLGRTAAADVIHVDDIRVVLESAAHGADADTFRRGRQTAVDTTVPVASAVDAWTAVAALTSRALRQLLLMRVIYGHRLLVEGDTITPAMLSSPPLSQLAARGLLTCVVLETRSRQQLAAHLRQRDRGFSALTQAAQRREIERNWLYRRWLRTQRPPGVVRHTIDASHTLDSTAQALAAHAGWALPSG